MATSTKKKNMILKYATLVRNGHHHPTRKDMERFGYTVDAIKHHLGSLNALREAAKTTYPDAFKNVIDESIYNKDTIAKLEATAARHKTFIITTAVTGCKVHRGFLQSINTFCKDKNAMLLILPSTDPASTAGFELDGSIPRDSVVVSDVALNSNIHISMIKLSAKQIDPITGLGRLGQRNGSFIYASPKQRLKFVPIANNGHPHAIMTTGAITIPDYDTERYMSHRTAAIAKSDHVIGAIIVETVDDKIYHFRQVQAQKSGAFVDLARYYAKDEIGEMNPEAIVLGDYHAGETDPAAEVAWMELIDEVRPNIAIFHDLFNGLSVNHHERNQHITRAIRDMGGQLDLTSELKMVDKVLIRYLKKVDKALVVDSNHHDFLRRWLEDGEYVKDSKNKKLGLALAQAMVDGQNPVKAGVEMVGEHDRRKVRWLGRDEDCKIAGIEVAAHGDEGPKGSTGSIKASEMAFGLVVDGHGHSAEILRGAMRVGTSSYRRLDYNTGPSDWTQTSCLIYPNGSRQLINVIDGKWKP